MARPHDRRRRPSRRRASQDAPAPPNRLPLYIGLGAGGLLLIVILVAVLSSGSDPTEPEPDPPRTANKPADEPSRPTPDDDKPRPRQHRTPALKEIAATEAFEREVQTKLDAGSLLDAATTIELARTREKSERWQRSVTAMDLLLGEEVRALVNDNEMRISGLVLANKVAAAKRALAVLEGRIPERHHGKLDALKKEIAAGPTATPPDPPKPAPPKLSFDEHFRLAQHNMRISDHVVAIQHVSAAIRIRPKDGDAHYLKGLILAYMSNVEKALNQANKARDLFDVVKDRLDANTRRVNQINFANLYALIYQISYEQEKALAEHRKVIALRPGVLSPHVHMLWVPFQRGEYAKARDALDALFTKYSTQVRTMDLTLRIACNIKLRDWRRAEADLTRAAGLTGGQVLQGRLIVGYRAWLHIEAAGAGSYSLAEAGRILGSLGTLGVRQNIMMRAILQVKSGGHDVEAAEAFDEIKRTGSIYLHLPEFAFYHGVAKLRLHKLDEAVEAFVSTCRLRSSMLEEVRALPGSDQIMGAIRRRLGDYQGQDTMQLSRVAEDHAAIARALVAADGRLLSHQYADALADYESLAGGMSAKSIKSKLAGRIARTKGYVSCFDRFIDAVNKGRLGSSLIEIEGRKVRITKADRRYLHMVVDKAQTRVGWQTLRFTVLLKMIERMALRSDELLSLGMLSWLHGDQKRAHAYFVRAGPSMTSELEGFLADVHDLDSGTRFVRHEGRFVSRAEKVQLTKGKVRFEGRWVAPADRDRLRSGHKKVGGRWIKLSDEELAARGFIRVGDRWVHPSEHVTRAGTWSGADQVETTRFTLRSDMGKGFLERLGTAVTAATTRLSQIHGTTGSGGKLTLMAFKNRREYLAYLARFKTPAHAAAAKGTGLVPSEPRTGCAVHRFIRVSDFTRACVGRAAELYVHGAYPQPPPAWLLTGTRVRHEGFVVGQDGKVDLSKAPRGHLGFIRRALRSRKQGSLAALLSTEPGSLKGTRELMQFEARAAALVYFFERTIEPGLKKRYSAYLRHLAGGGTSTLRGFFGADFDLLDVAFGFFIEDL